ncbi:deaminase reductase [Devosia pacifica]|uniref:Deaminase reductase n=1 Tax=Devosia pacifica TaxID=1335967 RepID=A0A918VYF1_9HYPH|nr:dihydrofolate reductase family protein [Devosia pacifica]GHA36668.1 deaminase reductase [Devosia pacifica]
MGILVSTAFISLDGVMEAPGGEPGYRNSGWTFNDIEFEEAVYEMKGEEQAASTGMMFGRVSYQAFSAVWPSMTDEFARYNALPKYIVSTSLAEKDLASNWGPTEIIRSFDDVAKLKQRHEGIITIHGSAALCRSLADAGLIDRYHLLVFPTLLGAGKRLFSEADKDKQMLRLTDSKAYSNGVQKLVYEVRHE